MHYLVYIRYLWCEPGLITIYNIILTTPPSSWSSVLKDHEFPSATIMKKMVSGGQYDMLSYSKLSVVYTGIKAIKSIKTVNGVMCRLTCIIGGKYFRYWTYCPDMNNHNKLYFRPFSLRQWREEYITKINFMTYIYYILSYNEWNRQHVTTTYYHQTCLETTFRIFRNSAKKPCFSGKNTWNVICLNVHTSFYIPTK